MKYYNVLL